MRINRENYEAWFLDYIEGKLNSSETEILMEFLSGNPDLKSELENFETVSVTPENSIFPSKENLKKNIGNITAVTDSTFDEFCVAKIEGVLDEQEVTLLDSYLQDHPEKQKEYEAYQKTVLQPDLNIVFDRKRSLKQYRLDTRIIIRTAVSIAASVLLLLMLFNYYSGSELKENTASINRNAIKSENETIPAKGKITIPENTNISHNAESSHKKINKKILVPVFEKNNALEERHIETMAYMQTKEISIERSLNLSEVPKVRQLLNENLANLPSNQNEEKEIPRKKKFDVWTLAQIGADGINSLTGLNIRFIKTEDFGNKRKRVEFEAGLLTFYSSSDKK